ncbi:MAG: TonB-dependent receptor [Reichenbachiella sp.]
MIRILSKCKTQLLVVVLLLSGSFAFAQIEVSGTVTAASDGMGIPGVTVLAVGTTVGTVTDIDGNYQLTVENGEVILKYSFIGYSSVQRAVGNSTQINIQLEEEVTALDEIVVVGYGVQKKKEVTGAVTSIKADVISKTATNDVNTSLQGTVAGLNVQASSGSPGASSNIQIRGLGSFSSGGASPLYIVDGIPYNGNPNLSPAEVESIEVLKDGASAAIYGTRASNGVILITTKNGKEGKLLNIEYSGYYGVQNVTSGVPLLSTEDAISRDEASQRMLDQTTSQITSLNPGALTRHTDFVGAVVKDNAPMHNHDLSISGGKKGITYSALVNYFAQDGMLENSNYERLSGRFNTRVVKGKFEGFASFAYRVTDREIEPFGIYQNAISQRPYVPLPVGQDEVFLPYTNPQNIGNFGNQMVNEDLRNATTMNAALSLKYEIIDGLSFMVRAGGNKNTNDRTWWQPKYLVYAANGELESLSSREDASLLETTTEGDKWTLENILNYAKSFGDHNFNFTVGYTAEKSTSTQNLQNTVDSSAVFNSGNAIVNVSPEFKWANTLVGMLGRVTYNYKERYLFSASIRRDGSSNFGPNNRYGIFPGFSAGWNISEESFFLGSGLSGVMDGLKLRASYAQVGNQNIPSYLYTAQIDEGSNYPFGTETDGVLVPGSIQRAFANPDIQWETNLSRNIGMDLSFFGGKLTVVTDVYKNSKQDMLLPVELAPSVGTWIPNSGNTNRTVYQNIGDMVNQGFELAIGYNDKEGDFQWDVMGTFSKNSNEVTELPEGFGEFALGGGLPIVNRPGIDNTTFLSLNRTVGAFLLIPTDGIISDQEELDAYNSSIIGGGFALGDLKYVDVNGDSVINSSDRRYAGSGTPDFEMGLGLNASYKNFDLFVQLYYVHGTEVYNGSRAYAYQSGRHQDLLYQWTPANPDSPVPSHRNNAGGLNFRTWSDYFLEDGTYLRVRNITLGYSVPKSVFKDKIETCRIYFSAQNPLTFTNYTGFDPEIGYSSSIFNRGVDRGNYPVSRRFLVGLQVKF